MPTLPTTPNPTPTIDQIYQLYIDNQGDWRRDHLGASQIGTECERKLWYDFRWCSKPSFDGRMLRLFQTGNREEARILNELVKLRLTVYTRHPVTGLQIHYDWFGGHFGGNLDAIGLGFEEAPKSWHVVELKTSNTKNFTILKNKGVRAAKWEHYCQMQVYMGGAKLERAYYICVCKDTDELYGERIHFEKELFLGMVCRAERVIFSPEPCTANVDDYRCRWCDHADICRGTTLPEVSCRTCAHATPMRDGKWMCLGRDLSSSDQRHPCETHIFIPALVGEPVDADEDFGTVTYNGGVMNGPGGVASVDLWKYVDRMREKPKERCCGNTDHTRPFAPYEPDMSGVAYQTEFDPP